MILRDYQNQISQQACDLLKTHKIAYLSMQVRTGKTITALNTAKLYGATNVLFVTKKKAIGSITADYEHYKSDYNITIINFEQLHNVTCNFDLIIIDEAHSLGQFPTVSLRTKHLKEICKGLPIIYLSGTPSPESYSQLYHQFFVSSFTPFEEVNFYKWANTYVNKKTKYVFNRQIADYSEAKKDLIESKTNHLFLSFTQVEAGFTELVNEHIHHVPMPQKLQTIINRLRINKVLTGKYGQTILADTEVKLLNKLHQLHTGTIIFDEVPEGEPEGAIFDMYKFEYIFDKFVKQQNNKIAIFYKFKNERLVIITQSKLAGVGYTESPEEFQSEGSKRVFLSQFQSGREGINLSAADCLVCVNIDFSAITYFQVRARLQSKDRQKEAAVHWIFSENGIEDKIYRAVSNKKDYTLSYFRKDEGKRNTTPNNKIPGIGGMVPG